MKFKKLLSMLLTAGILMTSLPVYSAAAAVGDLNDDGVIDKNDVTLFAQYFAGWPMAEDAKAKMLAAGDVNGDEAVTRADAMELARSVGGWNGYGPPTMNEKRNEELSDIAAINDGELPEIYLEKEDNIPQFIMGKYSDTVVTDYDSAIESLNDIQNLMLMEAPEDSFVGMDTSERNGTSFYKLQQTYKGLRVYGKQVIVSTDEDGNIKSMSGDYDPLFEIDTTPVVSEEEARAIASEECGYENTAEAELVIYTHDTISNLAWLFSDMCYDIVIDATNGSVLKNCSNIYSISYGGIDYDNTTWVFPVDYDNGLYYMRDTKRNINIHTAAKYTYDELGAMYPHWSNLLVVDDDNDWKKEYGIAAALFTRIIETYDYFENILGLKSYDNLGSPIQGFINLSNGFLEGINAYGGSARGEFAVILLTHHWSSSPSLQTIGHEFTHAVEKAHSNLLAGKETSAIMEAYSDIMGELVEEYYLGVCDWIDAGGIGRNIKNPLSQVDDAHDLLYPVHYYGTGYYTGTYDDYGSHHNSTVISHAIYNLIKSNVIDSNTLAKLLFHTLEYINQTCDFSGYRLAVYYAAKNLKLSNDVLEQINIVFDSAKIPNNTLAQQIDTIIGGDAYDAETKHPISSGCTVKIRAGHDAYTGEYLDYENMETVCRTFEFRGLTPGKYTIEVSHPNYKTGYLNIVVRTAYTVEEVDELLNYKVELEPIPTYTINIFVQNIDDSTAVSGITVSIPYLNLSGTTIDGKVTFTKVPAGVYNIVLSGEGYKEEIYYDYPITANGSKNISLSISKAEALPTVFSLTHTAADGTVTDLLASPNRSMYNGPAPLTWTLASPSAWQATMSGDCSWFTLDKKSGDAGTMELKLQLLSGTDTARTGTITFNTLDDGKTYSITLTQTPGTVSGITTHIDGTVMDGVTVTVSNANYTSEPFTTVADGKFTFALPNGCYDLTLSKEGYESTTFTSYFEVNGQNVDIGNRSLPIYLTGSITDATEGGQNYGQKISGVTVQLYDSENKLMETATTDANGVFGFSFYTEDTYSLTFTKTGYQTKTEENISITKDSSALGQFSLAVKKNPQYVMKYFNDHTYLVVNERMSWSEAKKYCESLGGHLVTITSQEENDFVSTGELFRKDDNKLNYPGMIWIGFSDAETEGTWKWVTNETAEFTCWNGTSPQDSTGSKDYAVLVQYNINFNGTLYEKGWHNWESYQNNTFVCEWDSVVDESVYTIDSGTCGDNLTWELDVSGTLTISGTGDMYDYSYSGDDIPWGDYDDIIKHIDIRNGVTSIGENAFKSIREATISFSNDLKSIGDYAFQNFRLPSQKTSLVLPDSLEFIGIMAFYATNITEITIPAAVQYISPELNGNAANNPFENAWQLETITVDENNSYFCSADGILYTKDMSVLIAYPEGKNDEKYVMPSIVTEVVYGAFGYRSNNDSLKEMTISENLDSINGIRVDSIEKYVVPETNPYFTAIDGVMYSKDLKSLCLYPHAKPDTKYTVLDGVTRIEYCSFESCNNLLSVVLPNTITDINSFSACNVLNKVVIPESVRWISGFEGCRSLSDVYFYGDAPNSINGFSDYYNGQSTLHYLEGKSGWEVYEGSYPLQVFDPETVDFETVDSGTCGDNVAWKFNIDGVLTLSGSGNTADYTSYYYVPWKEINHLIRKIVIEEGITSIGNSLFDSCENMTEVAIPETITSIGKFAFDGCKSLMEVVIPDSVLSIGDHAFYFCDMLTSVTLPKNLMVISNQLFANCSNLSNIVLPDGITSIGEYAFGWCDNLTAITIPASVTAIERNAFYHYYENLTDVYFLGNVPSTWGGDAFPDHVVIHYISGKSGWDAAADGTWTAPDGTVYNTATWTP